MLKKFAVLSCFCLAVQLIVLPVPVFAEASKTEASLRAAFFASQLGVKEKAEELYRKVTAEEPENAAAWFMYGHFLMAQKRSGEARDAFKKVISLDSKFKSANLALGQLAFREGRYDEAVDYLDRELVVNRRSGDAQYWLARVYQEKGQMTEARKAYEKAFKHSSLYREQARAGLEIVQVETLEEGESFSVASEAKRWNLGLESGFLYTDNVAGLDNKVLKPDDLSHRGDFGWNYGVDAGYQVVESKHFDFRADYALNQTLYFQAEDFNQLSNSIVLTPELKQGNASLFTELFWHHETLGGDPFRYQLGFAPGVGYDWKRFRFTTGYRWARNYYHFEPSTRDQDRDGWEQAVNWNIVYYPSRVLQYVVTGLELGSEEATGKDYDHKSLDGYFLMKTREYRKFSLKSAFSYGFSSYDQQNTAALIFESQRRRSQDVGLSAELIRRLGNSGASLYLNWSYGRSASNITFYTQTKNTVVSGVRWEF